MYDNFYKQLNEDLPIGYARYKIIFDKAGIPCDYEFIEVNLMFEKITGLRRSGIIGRKITKVQPDIKKSEFDLIHYYADVAINGGRKELKQFLVFCKRWFNVNIYSPEKHYFITYFIDITKEISQSSEMQTLVGISEEFLQITEQKIGYQKITDDFLKITGAKYSAFSLFNEDGKSLTTMASSGSSINIKKASRLMGFNIEGKRWNLSPAVAEEIKGQMMNGEMIKRFNTLRELIGNMMPRLLVALIEKTFNIGEVFVLKILRKNIMVGTFTFIMKKGESFDKGTLAGIYTRQLGMVITRKQAEDELSHEKNLTDAIFNSAPGLIYLYDNQGRLIRWNKKYEGITGYSAEELSEMNIWDWFKGDEKSQNAFRKGSNKASEEGFGDGEAVLHRKDGMMVPIYFTGSSLYLDGNQYFAGIAIDITERKKKESEIFYLSYHDQLTGLYNRRFYEEELKRLDTQKNLPITIVMGDVNGLKLINDSFGHTMGDELIKKVAEVITNGCRADDIITRVGGDEFVIILPQTNAIETKQIIRRIFDLSLNEKVCSIDISISFGYATKNNEEEDIQEIFKKAEDYMYNKKVSEGPTMRKNAIKNILNTLYEKSKREKEHSLRVSKLCISIGTALGLSVNENKELELAGLLHDIGKIAINENVLSKAGKLTDDEWKQIKHHPEIGYRILNTVNDMSYMAHCILYHHERWDGKGYPKGLKGYDIPLMSRIIAIIEAYDEMTSESNYHNPLSEKIAIEELQKNEGTQFDSELVNIFIEKVLGQI